MNVQTLTPKLLIKYKKSYFESVSSLVLSPPIPDSECKRILQKIENQWWVVFVLYDDESDMLVWTWTVYTQQKLSKWWAISAHIEEICVHPDHQWKGVGTLLMKHAIQVWRDLWCYKALLNCDADNAGWYERFWFEQKEVEMKMYL